MVIKISCRKRSFQMWPGSRISADPSAPNVFATAEDEQRVIAEIQNDLKDILAGRKKIPSIAPADFRKALKPAIVQSGERLQEVARWILSKPVLRKAIQIAAGREAYNLTGGFGSISSNLAVGMVTATPYVEEIRKDVAPPDCALKAPEARHTSHPKQSQKKITKEKHPEPSEKVALNPYNNVSDCLAATKREQPLIRKN